jgi:hypothetical protein
MRASTILIISGLASYRCYSIVEIKGLYLSCLILVACLVNMSCVNLNSIICTTRLGVGSNEPFCSCVAPFIYIMSRHSPTRYVFLVVWHVHGRMHSDSRWGHVSLSLLWHSI